jgi:DNA mismatch repair protein MutS2
MLYPTSFENKLGFDLIRDLLKKFCLSPLGIGLVNSISFSDNEQEIYSKLRLTGEMLKVITFEDRFPSQDYYNLVPELTRIRIPGTYMEPETISELRLSLQSIHDLVSFFSARKEEYPGLFRLLEMISGPEGADDAAEDSIDTALPEEQQITAGAAASLLSIPAGIIRRIDRILDERSQIRDTASAELTRLRKEKNYKLASVEHKILHDLKVARQSGWTPEDAEVTVRNGRLVIPMLSAHKRKISGYVHDESATGQTVYLEPVAIFETNNEIRELEYAEKREILKILIGFTDELRPDIQLLFRMYKFLGVVDFIRAKALLANETGAVLPKIAESLKSPGTNKPGLSFSWHQAVHPNLLLHFRKINKNVVPLDLEMKGDERILIISGPNAGGKSVCLKTAGLVQYMFQCGLLPPVREDSEFLIFKKIFIDIGDEQSIDNDLSTYTSKLLSLKYFIEYADKRTLLLIDEFGSGTDPSQGGAMAEACLEKMAEIGCYGIITTHYSNLKLLAGKVKGIVNGAMLYDSKKFKPLYVLKKGKPGSSFAFEIAAQIGFPPGILGNARNKTGQSQLNFERQIQDLETEKDEMTKKSTELKVADDFLSELIGKYEKLSSELERSKKEILENARQEALRMVSDANKTIERTVKDIKEAQAEKERTKTARTEIKDLKEKLEKIQPPGPTSGQIPLKPIRLSAVEQPLATETPRKGFEPLSPRHHQYQSYLDELNRKLYEFQLTLDIRGKRVDEALFLIQKYVDDAVMLSIPEVRILHGKGNGVLRQVTRDYLRSVKEVKSSKDEQLELGGAGVTVVAFR